MASSTSLRNRKQAGESKEVPALHEEDERSPAGPDKASQEDPENKSHRLTPLIERALWSRLDVAPFVVAYVVLVALDGNTDDDGRHLVTVAFAATLLTHLAVVLSTQWSVLTKARVGYRQAAALNESAMKQWTHCLVQTINNTTGESAGIVNVNLSEDKTVAVVSFHDTVFRCSTHQPDLDVSLWQSSTKSKPSVDLQFRHLRYPVDLLLSFYPSWKGHASLSQVTTATQVYGPNQTVLQLPSFWDLLSEQVVAPFFLFQIFCVVLWSLDEYWYYALFTLGALFMFESTVAYNRLNSLQRLHQAGHKGDERMWVRRGGLTKLQWMAIPTRELVPGDVICLTASSADGTTVPADILLLSGSGVCDEALLTGESIPQLKQALDVAQVEKGNLDMQDGSHKESILFGGTNLLVATAGPSDKDSPPVEGVTGMVLRTGFETAQGNLLRTMAHSSKNADSIHTWDTFVFILMLICCAVAAATWVLKEGWYDERRNRFRLLLHVIIIITSVVPPELPMELSLAVTNSVAALMRRCQVYCTELFRIPWAGEVDVCCFDKTGTITSDEMQLRGIRLFDDTVSKDEDAALLQGTPPWHVLRIMAACHSLATAGRSSKQISNIIGDPLELAVLTQTGYQLLNSNIVAAKEGTSIGSGSRSISILHRFAFSSKLKRMTVLITEEGGQGAVWALTKGAPETLKEFITKESMPSNYDDISFHHMSRGRRVLAMAFREAGTVRDLQKLKDSGRDVVERDLTFAGFLVLDTPLKPDSKSVISELRKSRHEVVMITGDAILTAAEVARQVGIIEQSSSKRVYRIQERPENEVSNTSDILASFECIPLKPGASGSKGLPLSHSDIGSLVDMSKKGEASFCIAGDVLTKIALSAKEKSLSKSYTRMSTMDEKNMLLHPVAQSVLTELVPLISVFARHAPHQKEAVIAALNHGGYHTLMCGDGTNDVGALKRAHVGISIVSAPEVEAKQREASAALSQIKASEKRERKAQKKGKKSSSRHHSSAWEESLRQLREAQEELDHVELGDASVAAPFTSRAVSIKCCKDVIQQGRCTLVTMLQIYKILGINCLVNAMVLSKLFLHGVKQGDRQLTILGVVVAALFYLVTRAEPLPTLSVERPPASVLCTQALLSVVMQFAVHFSAILLATEAALLFVDPYDPSLVPDGPFNPNVLNSCTFLLTCLATVNTFAVNYRGRPFMEDLRENKYLYRTLQACYAALIICALEAFPPLNDLMQLTPLPRLDVDESITHPLAVLVQVVDFPVFMCGLMAIDTVLAFAVETFVLGTIKH